MSNENSKKTHTVLVVEDSEDSRDLAEIALKGENYEVLTAASGLEALAILSDGACPDLILLDLSMPEMSGKEFVIELRKHEHCSHAKVIVVSGWDDIAKRAQEVGAGGYLRKPFDLRVLAREVRRHIEKP